MSKDTKHNGHDELSAEERVYIDKMLSKKKTPDEIIKGGHYPVATSLDNLTLVFADKRGRLWADYSNKLIKLFDPRWVFEE